MGWLDGLTRDMSLRKSFFIYLLLFLILGLLLMEGVEILSNRYILRVQDKNLREEIRWVNGLEESYYVWTGDQGGTRDLFFYKTLLDYRPILKLAALILGVFLGFNLYFKHKIKYPLEEFSQKTSLDKPAPSKNELDLIFTEYREAVDLITRERQKLWRETESMDQFMASFQHDIRTPITLIKGYNQILLEYYESGKLETEKIMKIFQSTERQIEKLEIYIDNMTGIRRLEDIEIELEDLDFNRFIKNLDNLLNNLSKGKEFQLSFQSHKDRLLIDEHIVMEVLSNIITNGFRYSKNLLSVDVVVDDYLRIDILDDGVGFSNQALDYGKSAFYTEGDKKNKGLGLFIATNLLKKHGGSLSLGNENGARVSIIIPLGEKL